MGVLKDEMLVAEEKEIGGRRIPYILQGEMLMSNGSSLVNVDDWSLRRLEEEDEVGNWRLIVWLNHRQ